MGAHTPVSAPHCRQFSEGGPSPTSLPTLRVGHGCSHPGLGPALQTVQWRRTLPHLPAYLAGGPWVLTPRPGPLTADSSVKADPPPPPSLPCGWAMGAHTPAWAPHCRQFSEGGPSPTSLPTLRVGHGCSHPGLGPALQTVQWRRTLPHLPAYLVGGPWVLTPRPRPRTADISVKADPPPPPCLPCGWAMGAHTPAWAPHCRQFSEGGPSPTSLPTLRMGHGCSHPGLGPALQTVQWRRTLPHLPAYLAGGPWVLTPRPRPRTAYSSEKADPPLPPCLPCGWAIGAHTPASARTADSSVKTDPPPPPCLPCEWAMGAHTQAWAPHCRQFSEGGPSPTSLPTLRVGHGCPHPGLGPALQTVEWRRPTPTSLPTLRVGHGCSHPASAPHCRQFSEGGPSPTSLNTLRVGHGCSHPGLGPALQTVQWRRTLPHLPAYLAGGPWVLTPRPRPRTADSSVKADPPPPPCLPCGWAMGAHTPAWAPHCRQFSEGGPSPTSLPNLRVGHGCSHPSLHPALQTVQWRRTLPHLPAYLAGGPWVLTPRTRPRTADSSVKAEPPPPPCLPCGWAMGAHTPAWAPHCRQFSEGGPSPTSLPTLRVGHGCSHPALGPGTADSSVKADPPPPPCLPCGWATGAHTPASAPHCRQFSEGGPSPTSLPTLRVGHGCSHHGLGPALQTVQWRRTLPHLPAYLAGGPWVLTPRPRPRTADSSVKADPPPPPCLPCGWAMGAHTPSSALHCRQFSEGGPSPTSLPTLRVGHGCSHPGLGPALQTVQWRRTLPHLPAYFADGPWVLTPRSGPRTADSSVKADPPPPPCLPCGWAMDAHIPASAPHCRQLSEGDPPPPPCLPCGWAMGAHTRPRPRTADSSVKADPPPPPWIPCGWAMGAHTPASAPHCRQFSEGGPSPTSLPTLRVGHGCSHPGLSPHCRQFSGGGPTPTSLPTLGVGYGCSHPGLGPALQTVQWRRTLPHLPAYLAGGPWMPTSRPPPRTADSSVKADPPPPPCLPCRWAMGVHIPTLAPHCRQFSEGGPSPTSLPNLRVGHGCSHPGLRPALQTVQWRRTLPHLPAYIAGGPWVLTPRPRPRTADSLVKADPPPPPCLPCGWAMGAHTPAWAPHCRQFSEGGPSPTSLPTLRVGHGCSHPGLGPALQTVQWRRTIPHLPAYLAGGPWVLTPRPRPHTADSSVKADPPPPPCLPCGWAMGAHTQASAPHCRQFSEGGPSPTSLPTLRVGHECSHPGLGPALHTVQWRRTLPHLPAYLAGGPWVLTPRPRPSTAYSSVKADPPPPPCLPCGWAMGAHTPAWAPHCRQCSEGGPSPTSLPTLLVGYGCSHPGLGPALQTVQWRRTLPHLPAYLAGGPWVLTPRPQPALQTVKWRRTHPHLPAYLAGGLWVLTPRPWSRTADSSVKADPPPPPCLPCGWAMGAHTPAWAPHCRQFSEGGPSPTSLPTLRVGHGCSHPGLGPALQTVQWRRTLPHLPAYLAGGPWVLTPKPRPRTADSSVKADPPPPPCLPCGWAMGAHTPAWAPHCWQFSEGGPSPTSLPTLRVGHGCSHPGLSPHCRQLSGGGPTPTSLPTLRVGYGCSHPGLGPALQTVQ